jgi:predicted RNA-binding Zn-ribbon protein involved in translation (DUF1610 family)
MGSILMPEKAKPTKTTCPACGGTNLDPKSVVTAVQPYERPTPPEGARPTRVIERKYACRNCGHQFSTIQEFTD